MSSYNNDNFGAGMAIGGFVMSLVMALFTVFVVVISKDHWNRELVDMGIKQYDTKTGELKYVTPQDCTQVVK